MEITDKFDNELLKQILEKAKDKFYYSVDKDRAAFVGIVERGKTELDHGDDYFIHVFKCQKCNEYFWFHNSGVYITRKW